MSDGGHSVPRITKAEHIGPQDTGDNIEAKRVALYASDTNSAWQRLRIDANGALETTASISGDVQVTSDPTFKEDPTNTGEAAKYGKVSSTSHKQMVEAQLQNSSGTEIGTTSNPVQVSVANTGANATAVKTDGSAVTQPVSGSVTANLGTLNGAATTAKQDTGNTSLSSIDGKITAVNTGAVVVSSSALPSGAATSANQPAVYTEDAAAAGDPTGLMQIARRKDTLSATEVSADGDNIALNATNKGQLHVKLADTVTVDGSGVTQPVSIASVPSHAVTNAGTFAVQAAEADGANVTLGAKADAKSTATDTTAVTAMSVLKQISASVQAPPSQAVTNAGTFAVQAAQSGTWTVQPGNTANTTAWKVDGSAVTQPTAEVAPTTILNGKKTVTTAGTRVTLAASTTCKSVTIKALAANTGTIYVGDTSVAASNGMALLAGESISLDIANLNTINLDSSVNGEGVTYLGVN